VVSELRAVTFELSAAISELSAGISEFSAAIAELSAGISALSAGIAELRAAIAELCAAIAECSAVSAQPRTCHLKLKSPSAATGSAYSKHPSALAKFLNYKVSREWEIRERRQYIGSSSYLTPRK